MADPILNPCVYDEAAEMIDRMGLCKTALFGHYTKAGKGVSTVGAIGSGCVRMNCIPDHIWYLQAFSRHAGVGMAHEVEAGKATAADVSAQLRAFAETLR